jgi:energy-converting hydrogenase Eha subunit B
VQPRFKAKKADAGTRTLRALLNSSSTEGTGEEQGLTTTYKWYIGGLFTTDPNTAGAWSATTVNALQAGVEIVI